MTLPLGFSKESEKEAEVEAEADITDERISSEPRPQPQPVVIPEDTPPDGGYGWVVCFAAALMNGFTWGVAAVFTYLTLYSVCNVLLLIH